MTASVGVPAAPAKSNDIEQRVIRFTGGASPSLVADDYSDAHGAVEVSLQFENTNPLCYAYRTNLAASGRMLPAQAPSLGGAPSGAAAPAAAEPASLDEAERALSDASAAVDRVLAEAQNRISLDDVWLACDSGGDLATQRARVEAALAVVQQQAGSNGAWRRVLEDANATADAAARFAGTSSAGGSGSGDAVAQAERDERRAQEAVDAAKHPAPKELTDALDRARDALARARSAARASEQRGREPERVARMARALQQKNRRATMRLMAMVGEVEQAAQLLRHAPGTETRRFPVGQKVTVEVTRIPLHRGRPMRAGAERFAVGPFRTLHPIYFDVGVGPALTLRNWREYGVAVRPTSGDSTLEPRIVRTKDEMTYDGVVSLSFYMWGARYLDDTIFNWKQLLPRPMLGFSMRQPFTSVYVGGQIDPIQFLDLSAGVRWYQVDHLMGPYVGNPAPLDAQGHPEDPVVRKETSAEVFVAVTASTDLVARWLVRGL